MTGFGRAAGSVSGRTLTVELRSVNSKQFDLSCKTSSRYRELEPEIKEVLRTALNRGKVDLFINSELPDRSLSFNRDTIRNYYNELAILTQEIAPTENIELMPLVMRLPEVTSIAQQSLDDEERNSVLSLVSEACARLDEFRSNEGARIAQDMTEQVGTIVRLLDEISAIDGDRGTRIRDRLMARLNELTIDFDMNRLEQELIYYLEKLDVNEEKVRLQGHCDFFTETLASAESSNGKKLGFIAQEMGREINTLGSKANDIGIQHIVVQMKENLEKVKEQVLNVL